MNKALALSAFALIMTLPLVSSASSITNVFVGTNSASGTNNDLVAGDTIQFEVTIQLNAGQEYTTILWTLSGDYLNPNVLDNSANDGNSWAGVNHTVTAWSWHYTKKNGDTGGKINVDIGLFDESGTAPLRFPGGTTNTGVFGQAVSALWGEFGLSISATEFFQGTGNPVMIGTVTITAGGAGSFSGGGYLHPTLGAFANNAGTDATTVSGGEFTVIPEPGTALLMLLGLGGLGVMGRSNRK